MTLKPKAYYQNGAIAWPISDARIANLYLAGWYAPAEGWQVTGDKSVRNKDGWNAGNHGEMRKERGS